MFESIRRLHNDDLPDNELILTTARVYVGGDNELVKPLETIAVVLDMIYYPFKDMANGCVHNKKRKNV